MRNPVTFFSLMVLLILSFSYTALAEDYLSEAFNPEGAQDRSTQLYPVNDFDDVIFNREYFYTLQEGEAQLDRSGDGTRTKLEFDWGIFGLGKGNTK